MISRSGRKMELIQQCQLIAWGMCCVCLLTNNSQVIYNTLSCFLCMSVIVQMHCSCISSVRGCVYWLLWFSVSIYTRGSHCIYKVQSFLNCFLPSCANFVLLLNGSKGSVVGHWVKAVQPVRFMQGNNDLLLLTQTVGLQVNIYYLISPFIFFLTANCDHFRLCGTELWCFLGEGWSRF